MEDEKIIELYWNRDQGAIRHTAEKYGSYCGRQKEEKGKWSLFLMN